MINKNRKFGNRWKIAYAILGVPLLFACYVAATYWISLSQGFLPFTYLPEWFWYTVFAILVASGFFTFFTTAKNQLVKYFSILYLPLMSGILLVIHLSIACGFGDCL